MGSCNSSCFVAGDQSAGAAYNEAVRNAVDEYGTDPYNGTISTSSGIRVFSHVPVTMPEAYAIEQKELENLSKWEAWGAVAIVDETCVEERTIEKSFRLTTPTLYPHELIKVVTPLLALKPGERVKDLDIMDDDMKWVVDATTPDGDRQVVYQVQGVRSLATHRYSSLAEARAALTETAKNWGQPVKAWNGDMAVPYEQRQPMDAAVFGVVDRGAQVPMLTVKTAIKSRTTKLKITLTRATDTSRLGGWYFFGWAAM